MTHHRDCIRGGKNAGQNWVAGVFSQSIGKLGLQSGNEK
jgi:hypothetical protein